MDIIKKIDADLTTALKNKDESKILTLRGLKSSLHNKEIELQKELSEEDSLAVISKEAKQREDSISQYKKGGREDLARKEELELKIIKTYLPEAMDKEELSRIIDEVIKTTGAKSMSDMGRVMGEVMKQTQGRADGAETSGLVKEKLSKLK
jgi:uncharacterized protein YqeY